jgi:hypothetical protein
MGRKAQVTDRINATMDAVQAPRGSRTADGALRITERPQQLANRDHAVLLLR